MKTHGNPRRTCPSLATDLSALGPGQLRLSYRRRRGHGWDTLNPHRWLSTPESETWQASTPPETAAGSQVVVLPEGNFLHVLGGSTSSGLSARHLIYQALYTVAIPLLSNE